MSVFVDTGVFYAHHDRDAARHDEATVALDRAVSGTWGHLYTSDYVLDETVALTRSRAGSFVDSIAVADRILGRGRFASAVELTFVGEDGFYRALDVLETYRDHPLSFTDATTIALMDENEIDALLSFDADFDGIVERLDPIEVEER
jgi:predicted nucleic acid-binding protein